MEIEEKDPLLKKFCDAVRHQKCEDERINNLCDQIVRDVKTIVESKQSELDQQKKKIAELNKAAEFDREFRQRSATFTEMQRDEIDKLKLQMNKLQNTVEMKEKQVDAWQEACKQKNAEINELKNTKSFLNSAHTEACKQINCLKTNLPTDDDIDNMFPFHDNNSTRQRDKVRDKRKGAKQLRDFLIKIK